MPMPNFYVCEIRPSSDFQKGSQRTLKRGKVQVLIARLKDQTRTTAQSIHYPITGWDEAQARADCEKKGGRFVAAKEAD